MFFFLVGLCVIGCDDCKKDNIETEYDGVAVHWSTVEENTSGASIFSIALINTTKEAVYVQVGQHDRDE